MKLSCRVFFIVIGLALIMVSCNEKTPLPTPVEPEPFGEVHAKMNGSDWPGTYYSHGFQKGSIRLSFQHDDVDVDRQQVLSFYYLPDSVGVNYLNQRIIEDSLTPQTRFSTTLQEDIIGNIYLLDTTLLPARLEILEYMDNGNEIMGTFQAGFVIDTNTFKNDPGMPDTVIFTEGYFHTAVKGSYIRMY